MTDPHQPPADNHPLDPLDELASAHLDGATEVDEAARVTADAELARRVDRLAAVRDAMRATADEPVDPAHREAAIGAALVAFAAAGHPDTATPHAKAAPAALVHPSRRRPRTRTLQLAGIAAAAALLALSVPLLDRLGSDSSDDTASSSFEATGRSVDPSAEAGATAGGGAADSASDAEAFDAVAHPELGAFADLDALQAAVRDQLQPKAGGSTTPAPAMATTEAASAPPCAPPADVEVVYTARASVAGQPVTVVVHEAPSGQRTLVVLDAACATLSEERL